MNDKNKYPGGYQIIDLSALNGKELNEAVEIPGIYQSLLNSKKPIRFTMKGLDAEAMVTNQTLLNCSRLSITPESTNHHFYISIYEFDEGGLKMAQLCYIDIGPDDSVTIKQ